MPERKIFKKLVGVEEAWAEFSKHFQPRPVGVEEVRLSECHGRVLTEETVSTTDVPGFDRAVMDGFAVVAQDTFGAEEEQPVTLNVVGNLTPGQKAIMAIRMGEAIEIATGAAMPGGANAVVMVEYTERKGDLLRIFKAVAPNENVMAAGSDIMAGELVLRRGTRITSREMGVLAAIGLESVRVYRRPRVAVLSTGNEIVPPGQPLDYAKIYDVNGNALMGALRESGCEPSFMGIVTDDDEDMRRKIGRALDVADAVITSGSTSAGVGDMIYRVIEEMGEPGLVVHGLSVKPGKPTIMGVAKGKPIFGLPGYPTSALMIFQSVVQPILGKMSGLGDAATRARMKGRVAFRIFSGKGRREFLPVHMVSRGSGGYMVYPTLGGSGAITSLAMADGFVDIPENMDFLDEGDVVDVELFSPELKLADLVIIGSHCTGVDLILAHLPSLNAKVINVGSLGGLQAAKRGEADIAGVHLLDEVTGQYNTPFIAQYDVKEAVLIRGYRREQGFITAPGNPKGFKWFGDLLRSDITFMNRNAGSGTRILIDVNLRKLAKEKGEDLHQLAERINGYHVEAKTHSAAASAVASGRADVAVGIRTLAHHYGLGFVPIADESYDFLVPRDRLQKPSVKSFIEALASKEFQRRLREKAPGLIPDGASGSIVEVRAEGERRDLDQLMKAVPTHGHDHSC